MPKLETRIAALEGRTRDEGCVVIIQSVNPGELGAEIDYLRADTGRVWRRLAQESELLFKERVKAEVLSHAHGVVLLYSWPMAA